MDPIEVVIQALGTTLGRGRIDAAAQHAVSVLTRSEVHDQAGTGRACLCGQ